LGLRYSSTEKPLGGEKMKKALLLSLALVGSALSANVFMGPEYAKELCEVWNKTPKANGGAWEERKLDFGAREEDILV
jgi:hypothetical protein